MLFKTLKKTAALFCMLALLAGALWVPVALAAKADNAALGTVTHPDGAVFEGWYTDAQFTEKMSFDTFGEDTVTVYAKWGSLPMNFSSYPFSTQAAIKDMK